MPHPHFTPQRPYSPGDWRAPRDARRTRGTRRARQRRQQRLVRRIVTAFAILGIGGALSGGLAFAVLLSLAARNLPDPSRLIQRAVPQSTVILDRTGETMLFELHGEEQRTWRPLSEISDYVQWAVVAIEDRGFYEHRGISPRGILRALWVNLRGGSLQGGSTISQQLVKNAILTPERTISRKLKDILIAYQLEQKFTKDEILTLYLNEIPFGGGAYGVESAASTLFGKTARDLDLVESAMLAALPKAPTKLSPYGSHTDLLVARTHLVLDAMAEQGYITRTEADAAKAIDVLARVQPRRIAITAPHFVMYVRELLTEAYGERMVEQGGLRVTTTLDVALLSAAEAAIAKHGERSAKQYRASNAALVAINPATGEILSMVGSRDFFNEEIDGQVNVAVRPRQPGSSFKPLVYAAAFRAGYTPDTLVADVATTFPTPVGAYEPENYNGKVHGFLTFRKALAGSLNIPAVKVLYLVGLDPVLDLADRIGYTTLRDRSRFGLALVLGGGEVTLLEHTSAYATFAADGIRRPTTAILRVEDRNGNVLHAWEPPRGERVLESQAVRQLTSILTDNESRAFTFGTTSPLAFTNRAVAAKTGTTNDYRDGWTVGYTPTLAWGVWVGNNDNTPMTRAGGSIAAAPIWRAFADAALAGTPNEAFSAPEPVVVDAPILRGVHPGRVRVRVDRTTGKRATELTPPEFIEEREYQDLHDILHYVRRDDPRGPPPGDPASDPMYEPWEIGVREWARKQGLTLGPPPDEVDDLHTEANRPTLTVDAPTDGAAITGRTVTVRGSVSAPRGVRQIRMQVDGIAAALLAPQNGTYQHELRLPAVIDRGRHELRVTACDDVANCRTSTVAVDVQSEREPIALTWESPAAGATLPRNAFPVTLRLRAATTVGANRVEILVTEGGEERTLTRVVPPADGLVQILWPSAPGAGTVSLRARLSQDDTVLAESAAIELHITN